MAPAPALRKPTDALDVFPKSHQLHGDRLFAACLIQWGKVFVQAADDALNAGDKKDASSLTGHP
ncbi:hypothetical protein BH18VER2_BH18VER2_08680 [soil metagenome]